MSGCELIIYATPTGPLAAACEAYFSAVEAVAPTVAQTYPPHCTLTGFFRRSSARRDAIAEQVARTIGETGHPPPGTVEVVGLGEHADWVGLELRSPWLLEWTAALAQGLPVGDGEDELRLKTWLHMSLAYGVEELDHHRSLADELIDPTAEVDWRLGLWERVGDSWTLLAGG